MKEASSLHQYKHNLRNLPKINYMRCTGKIKYTKKDTLFM